MSAAALYELEPIGVDGAMEANGLVYRFCNEECRTRFTAVVAEASPPLREGTDDDYEDGTVCDECGKELKRKGIISERWASLLNRRMAEKLTSGEALSVLDEGVDMGAGGFYKLRRFVEDVDYCDPATESWIWSIGRSRATGEIVASIGTGFYQNEAWECLFLR